MKFCVLCFVCKERAEKLLLREEIFADFDGTQLAKIRFRGKNVSHE